MARDDSAPGRPDPLRPAMKRCSFVLWLRDRTHALYRTSGRTIAGARDSCVASNRGRLPGDRWWSTSKAFEEFSRKDDDVEAIRLLNSPSERFQLVADSLPASAAPAGEGRPVIRSVTHLALALLLPCELLQLAADFLPRVSAHTEFV